jgi:NTE family protein
MERNELTRRETLKAIGLGGTALFLGNTASAGAEALTGTAGSSAAQPVNPMHPVVEQEPDPHDDTFEEGLALCLSGGGYRAMLFHLGTLWRLNESGVLAKLKRISSVSGGSITAGVLGYHWTSLAFDKSGVAGNFIDQVVNPVRTLASVTIDVGAILRGIFLPGSISDKVRNAYQEHLFGDATLQALPDEPRFVMNATNVQSGTLWRFSKPYMADYRVGQVEHPTVPLAVAVGASSAFPPFLSPVELELPSGQCQPFKDSDLGREPFTTEIYLTDGGVYDNLGLETAWKRYSTILVSDAGMKMKDEEEPHENWFCHMLRVVDIIDNQVRSLRKRQLIEAYKKDERSGAYWGIRSDIAEYPAPNKFPCIPERAAELAAVPTRLKALDTSLQQRLINWGFAICDAGYRSHMDKEGPRPSQLPYPSTGI